MADSTTTLRVDFVSESAGYGNTFGWYNSVTGQAGVLFSDVDADGHNAPLTPGVSSATFTVNTADVGNIQFFLIPNGGDDSHNTAADLNGPLKVIQLSDGTWAVAITDANGNVVTSHGQVQILEGTGADALFTETSKNAGGVDYASSTVGSNQTAATLAGDTADGAGGQIAWEDQVAIQNRNGTYSKPGDADYNDAVFKISILKPSPVANADAKTISEDAGATTINVLTNDTDPNAGAVLHVASVNTAGLLGTVSISADGQSVVYTPAASFQSLAQGETATETFKYTVADQFGGTSTATTTVTIVGANDAPVVAAALAKSGNEGSGNFTLNLLQGASDVDHGSVLSLSGLSTLPPGFTLSGSTLTVNTNFAAFDSLAVGETYTTTLTYNVVDQYGASVAQTATITINGTNDAPIVAAAISATGAEGSGAFAVDLLQGASDVDHGAVLSISNLSSLPTGFTRSGNTITVDTSNAAYNALAAGETSTAVLTYKVVDDHGATVNQTATIIITGTNDAPIVASALTKAGSEGTGTFSLNLLQGATDVDHGAVLSIASLSVDGLPPGQLPAGYTLNGSTLMVDTNSAAFLAMNNGQSVTSLLHYNVVDEHGASVAQSATVTVNGVSDAAPTTTLRVDFVSESASYENTVGWYNKVTGQAGVLFADVEADGYHAPLTPGVSHAEFTVNSSDVGNIQYFLVPDGADDSRNTSSELSGPLKVIQLSDGTWAVAIADANGNVVTSHGQPQILYGTDTNALFTETSKNAGGVDYASSTVGPTQTAATLAGDTADGPTGPMAWEDTAATKNWNGTYSKPGDADYNDAVFNVSIVNASPVAHNDAVNISEDAGATTINVLANDTDPGDTLSVASLFAPGLLGTVSIAPGGQGVIYTPSASFQALAAGETATETFNYAVLDHAGASSTATVTITIVGVDDAPVIATGDKAESASITELTGTTGSAAPDAQAGTIHFTDVDLTDRPTASISAQSTSWLAADAVTALTLTAAQTSALAAAFTINAEAGNTNNGAVDWNYSIADGSLDFLAQGETATVTSTVLVDDHQGGTDTSTVTVTITGTNDAPVITGGATTGSVKEDQAVTQATGQFTVADPDHGATQSWTVVGGTASANADYHFLADSFTVTKGAGAGLITVLDDEFSDGNPPPSSPPLNPGQPNQQNTTYAGIGAFTESGGKLHLDSNTAVPFVGVGTPDPFIGEDAIVRTNIDPTNPTLGLKQNATFDVNGVFDLILPDSPREEYGIRLTDRLIGGTGTPPDQPGNDVIELVVRENLSGNLVVALRRVDFASDVTTNLQSITLNAPAGTDQIRLHLDHVANASTVTASFDYLQGGVVVGSQSFSNTPSIFNGENWTRAEIVADAPTLTDSTLSGSYGTLNVSQAGAWTYTLDNSRTVTQNLAEGQHATDTFTVQVADQFGATDSRVINVDVVGTNDAPVMQTPAVSRALTEDQSTPNLTATGLAQFSDADLTDTHVVAAGLQSTVLSGGGSLPAGLSGLLAGAMTALLTDPATGDGHGGVQWDFSLDDNAVQFLAAGQTLTAAYAVTATDPFGAIATQTVTVTVTGTNDAPVLSADVSGPHAIDELTGITGSPVADVATGSLTFSDVDLTDHHTVSSALASAVWSGGPTLPADLTTELGSAFNTLLSPDSTGTGSGAVTFGFGPTDSSLDFLAAGETLTVTYNVTVSDGITSSTQPVTIVATGTNDDPVVSAISGTADEDGPATTLTAIYSDADATDTHTYSVDTTGTHGSVVNNGDGTFSYDPNGQFESLAQGQTATDTFAYTVTDNSNASSTQTATVTIIGENDAPVAHDDLVGPAITPVADTLTFDDGVDFSNYHGFQFSGNFTYPGGLTGYWGTDNSTTAYTYFTDSYGAGVLTRADGSDFDFQGVNVTGYYRGSNDDGTGPETLTGYLNGVQVASETFQIPGADYPNYIFDNPVVLQDAGWQHVDTVLFSDDGTAPYGGDYTWIDNIQVAYNTVQPNTEDGPIDINVLANDTDVDQGAVLSVAGFAATSTLGAAISLNPDGTLHYDATGSASLQALAAGETVSDTFTYTVQDEHGALSNTATVTVVVNGVNDAPVANPDVAATTENAPVTIDVLANDTDVDHGAVLTLQGASVPSGSVSIVNNELVFDPGTAFDYLATGVQTTVDVAYTMADEYGAQSSSVATITITGENDAPILTSNVAGALSFWAGDGNTNDSSGNNNGTPINGVSYAPGHDGQAFSFNGVGAFVAVADQLQNDFTITAWINTTQNAPDGTQFYSGNGLIYADVGGLANDFGTSIVNNHFAFGTGGYQDTTIQSTSTVTTGDWTYVAAVRSGSQISLYVNGVLEASADTGYSGPLNSPSAITFGGNTVDGRYYQGLLDDVTFFDHALTSTEIEQQSHLGNVLHYIENQAAAAINPTLGVSDIDDANLAGATVSITDNFVAGQDVLGFTDQNGITGSYDAGTGVLTLSGSATVAQYQAALQSVTYFNSSDDPSGLTRTVSYQVDDGETLNHASNVATATVTVTPVNDAPVNHFDMPIEFVGADIDTTQGGWRNTTVDKPLDADGDNVYGTAGYSIVYSAAHAGIATELPSFVSIIHPLDQVFAFGDVTTPQYQLIDLAPAAGASPPTELSGVFYGLEAEPNFLSFTLSESAHFRLGVMVDNTDYAGITPGDLTLTRITGDAFSATETVTNTDQLVDYYFFDVSGQAGDTFVLSGANRFPLPQSAGVAGITFDTLPDSSGAGSNISATLAVNEDTNLSIAGLSVSDVDAGSALITTMLSVAHGTLAVGSAGGAAVDGSGTGTVTLTGTVDQINTTLAAADNLVYRGVQDFNGSDALTITTNDHGATGIDPGLTGGPADEQDVDTINITVNPVNDAPVALNDSASGNEDTPITTGNVLANDSDVDNTLTAASINAFTQGAHGAVVYNNNGTFTYTPTLNYNGADSFTYTVTDGALTSTATVNVTINPVNDAPVAQNDSASGNEDTAITTGNVLANDSDVDNTLTAASINAFTQGAHGAVVYNNNGTFTYTPTLNYNGADSFTYTVTDGSLTSTATVDLTVNPVNDAPVIAFATPNLITNGSFELPGGSFTPNGGSTAIPGWTVTGNSVDYYTGFTAADGTHSLDMSGNTAGGVQQTLATVAGAQYTVSFQLAGNPDNQALGQTVKHLQVSAGATSQNYTFDVTGHTDANMGWTTQTFVFTATGSSTTLNFTSLDNSAWGPALDSVSAVQTSQVTNEDTPVTLTGLSVSDVDAGSDPVQVTLGVAHGALTLASTTGLTASGLGSGAVTLTGSQSAIDAALASGLTYAPAPNYNGSDSLSVNVNDLGHNGAGGALSASQSIALTVNPVNDAPVATNDGYSTNEDTPLTIAGPGVLGNDTDIDSPTLTSILVTGPSHGSLGLNSNGSFTYTPSANYNGSDSFTYKANDGSLDSNVATVNLTINAVNDAPVAVNDTLVNVPAGFTLNPANGHYYQFVNTSADINAAMSGAAAAGGYLATITSASENAFVASLLGSTGVGWFGATDAGHEGTWEDLGGPEDGTQFWIGNGSASGGHVVAGQYANWRASTEPNNGGGGGAENYAYIQAGGGWNDYNGAGIGYVVEIGGRPQDTFGYSEDAVTSIAASQLLANDTDVDGDTLTVTGVSAISTKGAAVSLLGTTISYNPAGSVTLQALAAGQSTTDTFTYTISDGHGGTSSATVTLTVAGVNDAPVLAAANPSLNAAFATAGESVATLLGAALTDVDGPHQGVAITGLSGVTLSYSTDGGASFVSAPAFSSTSALLLDASDLIRIVPTTGSTSASLTYQGWDESSGAVGSTGNASLSGGSTAFSTHADTASGVVPPAPLLAVPTHVFDTFPGSTVNAANWSLVAPTGTDVPHSYSATVNNGSITLVNREYLDTNASFLPTAATPLTITGNAVFTTGGVDTFAIVDRTTGQPGNSFGENNDGIQFTLSPGGMSISQINSGSAFVTLASNTFGYIQGDQYAFSVTDNGTQTSFTVTDLTHPGSQTLTASTSYVGLGDLVTFHNREGNDGTHSVTLSNLNLSTGTTTTTVNTPVALNISTSDVGYPNPTITIAGIPAGSVLSSTEHPTLTPDGSGVYHLDVGDLPGLMLTPPTGFTGALTLAVTSTEGPTISSQTNYTVQVVPGLGVAAADQAETGTITELANTFGSATLDQASGTIHFNDGTLGDRPTASIGTQSVTASGVSLTAGQITTLEQAFKIAPVAGGDNDGAVNWTYSIADNALDFLPANSTVTVTTPVAVSNGNGTGTVTVTIHGADDAPVAVNDSASGNEDTPITTGNVLANDSDVDNTLTASSINAFTQGAHGAVVYNNNGTFTYTPVANYNGSDSFTYTVTDGSLTSTATVNLTVNPVNDAPVITLDPNVLINGSFETQIDGQHPANWTNSGSGGAFEFGGVGSFGAIPSDGSLFLELDANTSGGLDFITQTVATVAGYTYQLSFDTALRSGTSLATNQFDVLWNGAVIGTVQPTVSNPSSTGWNHFTFNVVAPGSSGTVGFREINNDGLGGLLDNVQLHQIQSAVQVAEDTSVPVSFSVSDIDAGSSPLAITLNVGHGTLSLSSTTGLAGVTGNGTGTLTFTGSQSAIDTAVATALSYTGALNYNGTDTLSVNVSDQGATGAGGALSASRTIAITVTPVNDAPVAVNDTLVNAPAGFTLDPANGHYYEFVNVLVGEGTASAGAAAAGGYLATIADASENAFVAGLISTTSGSGAAWIGLSDAAVEGTFRWVEGPETGQIASFTSWRAGEPNNAGNEDFVYIDSAGGWNDYAKSDVGYVIEIGGRPQDTFGYSEDAVTSIAASQLLANDTDVDGDALTVTGVSATSAKGALVSLAGGTISYNPTGSATLQALNTGQSTTDTFTYTVSDGHGGTSTATVSLTVNGVSGDPIVLDTNGDGVHFITSGQGVSFDLNGHGQAEQLAWPSPGDGILVMDLDHSGAIENGTEVLSEAFKGLGFSSSMEALRSLDTNLDGVVDAADAQFADLRVWHDANSDGVSQPGELVSLSGLGIASISVNEEARQETIDGQQVYAAGTFTYTDGTKGDYVGVYLSAPVAPDAASSNGNTSTPSDPASAPHSDVFVFNQPSQTTSTIANFTPGSDVIEISAAGFGGGLTAGATPTVVTAAAPADATNLAAGTFIFDNHAATGGTLYFDANGGSGADATPVVTLTGVTTLDPHDLHVV